MRALLAVLIALAPLASAGHGAVVYFLEDGPLDGSLQTDVPADAQGSIRLVLPSEASYLANRFVADADGVVQGRAFAGLWIDSLPEVPTTLQVALVSVAEGEMVILAEASAALSKSMPDAPDPSSLVPPDPADPEGAAWHVIAQAYPLLRDPPVLIDFGVVDASLPEGAQVGIAFRIADGSLLPAGLEYGGMLAPSFVYVPFHPASTGSGSGGSGGSGGPGGSSGGSSGASGGSSGSGGPGAGGSGSGAGDGEAGKDSPLPLIVPLVLVAIAARLRR